MGGSEPESRVQLAHAVHTPAALLVQSAEQAARASRSKTERGVPHGNNLAGAAAGTYLAHLLQHHRVPPH